MDLNVKKLAAVISTGVFFLCLGVDELYANGKSKKIPGENSFTREELKNEEKKLTEKEEKKEIKMDELKEVSKEEMKTEPSDLVPLRKDKMAVKKSECLLITEDRSLPPLSFSFGSGVQGRSRAGIFHSESGTVGGAAHRARVCK
ncbi:hypothetical protein HYT01_04390 [Candidatus Giovannonibacteria bacterium]|nr:hypothetical protein [Candidatus Giovannonibacteria bacterium]